MIEYVKSFLYGGIFITLIKYFSDKISHKYSGLIAAIPVGLLATFFLQNDNEKKIYYLGYLVSIFVLFLVLLIVFLSTIYFINTQVNIITIFGILIWIIFSVYAVGTFES